MNKFGILAAGLCASLVLAACNTTEKQNTSAGAMGEKSACCADAKKCDAKCTGDAKTCTKADCCKKATAKTAAPGAVGDKKEGCCSQGTTKTSAKAEGCTATCPASKDAATCPVTGATKTTSMGAVGEKAEGGCCAQKSACTKQG